MRPIAEMADRCLSLMKPHELWSWDKWGGQIMGNGSIPSRKTYAYDKFIQKRLQAKAQINTELKRRKAPERLFCPGSGQGIYLVNEEDVSEITSDKRVRRIVSCFTKGRKEMASLATCRRISNEDKKMLLRLGGLIELQQNTMVGTMAKMRSLPPATKKRLLKHLGVQIDKN